MNAMKRAGESHRPVLKRELGVRDLTLFSLACIASTRWIAPAAAAGPGSIALWLLAAVFFCAPLALAVTALTVKYPQAGGMYLWTRGELGEWHGFLCFWVYWMGIAFWFPSAAMFYMSVAVYALGPNFKYLAGNRIYLVSASLAVIWIALGTNLVGLRIGKWTQNIGGVAVWLLGVLFSALAALVYFKRGSATPLVLTPRWNWATLSFEATIAYAMSGLEMIGLLGGEIREPERTVPRAGWIASALATVFYAGATLALLVLVPSQNISELNGIAEAGEAAAQTLDAAWLSPLAGLLLLVCAVGQFGGLGAAVSRLPFAAGVDHLLPPALGRIHPRWATPYVSILTFGLLASFLLIVVQIGDTIRAAYQALVSLTLLVGFLPFIYIFATAWKIGKRVSVISGLTLTVIAILSSAAPTRQITNTGLFEAKLAIGTLAVVASARVVYVRAIRRQGSA